jgi:hypothetical protein
VQQPVERLTPSSGGGVVYAGLPFDGVPRARRNPVAIAGAALSVVPLLGTILSILGLVRSQSRGGAGRTVATVGLVLSVAFTAGEAYAAFQLGRSAPNDPACVATKADVDIAQIRLSADATTLSRAVAADDTTAASATETALVTDLRMVESTLQRNASLATHANVRVGIRALDADLGTLISAVRQLESGDQAAMGQLQSAMGRLRTDGQSVDVLCGAPAA